MIQLDDLWIIEILKILSNASLFTMTLEIAIYTIAVPRLKGFRNDVKKRKQQRYDEFQKELEELKKQKSEPTDAIREIGKKQSDCQKEIVGLDKMVERLSSQWLVWLPTISSIISFGASLNGIYDYYVKPSQVQTDLYMSLGFFGGALLLLLYALLNVSRIVGISTADEKEERAKEEVKREYPSAIVELPTVALASQVLKRDSLPTYIKQIMTEVTNCVTLLSQNLNNVVEIPTKTWFDIPLEERRERFKYGSDFRYLDEFYSALSLRNNHLSQGIPLIPSLQQNLESDNKEVLRLARRAYADIDWKAYEPSLPPSIK